MTAAGYIGTYTHGAGGRSAGIYSFLFDTDSGEARDLRIAAEAVNPEFLVLSASKKFLYATHEINEFRGKPTGAVSAFAVSGARGENLSLINQVSSMGKSPCHIALDNSGTYAVVSNYMEGSVAVFPVHADGSLGECIQTVQFTGSGPNTERQEAPHGHFFITHKTPAGVERPNRALACDLGSDRIWRFAFDKNRRNPLLPLDPPFFQSAAGSGPRHAIFHPTKNIVYVANELACTVDVLSGECLSLLQTIPALPTTAKTAVGATAAAIKFGADARRLYVSIRGDDSIASFRVGEDGLLEPERVVPSEGRMPRDFTVDPTGAYLLVCHQESDNLVVFHIDRTTGVLEKTREYETLSGVCVIM
ncbi:MAG: lactonase family protein [Treponema sp.]|jgi:6-phosphogluconolactonase|nr:lactonase family protein [Treponema sp.]